MQYHTKFKFIIIGYTWPTVCQKIFFPIWMDWEPQPECKFFFQGKKLIFIGIFTRNVNIKAKYNIKNCQVLFECQGVKNQ